MAADFFDIPAPQEPDRARFVHPFDRKELIRYLEQLRLAHGTVKLLGLPDVDERNDDLPLRSLFVEPRVGPQQLSAREYDEVTAVRSTKPLLDALAEHPRLVLLGDPGAGKTTVVNWLCTALAQPLENEVTGTLGRRMPLPFILRDLALDAVLSWDTLLEQFLARESAAPLARNRALLEKLFDSGQALILLDGIDEVGSVERREALRSAVWEGWKRWPRCRWVLTSRIVGYSEVEFEGRLVAGKALRKEPENMAARLLAKGSMAESLHQLVLPGVEVYAELQYLSPFTDTQVRQFIENWFRLREPNPALGRETTTNLIAALEADGATKELARIPNLLTLIALIYRVRAKLPDGRAELYLQIAQAYLKTIDEYRKLTPHLPPYTFEEKMEWLARVGWEMQLARVGVANAKAAEDASHDRNEPSVAASREYLAPAEEVRRWLEVAMRARYGEKASEEAERFLDYVQRRTGLLLERGHGRFGFLHLSFQEFFAARHLAARVVTPAWAMANLAREKKSAKDDPTSTPALRGYCGSSLWQETLVFLCETLSRDWAEPVLTQLYPESHTPPRKFGAKDLNYSAENRARWLLAARLAGDPHVKLSAEFRERLMRACWQWELMRYQDRGPDRPWESDKCGVARQLLARQDTLQNAWPALAQSFTRIGDSARLSLSGCTGLSDLSPLEKLSGLQWLFLDGCTGLSDLSPLERLSGLQWLSLYRCTGLSDLSPLEMLLGLHALFIGRTDLSDLSPLEKLSGLNALSLYGCTSLSDLNPLEKLSGLQWLNLDECTSLSDLNPLGKLSGLQTLYLTGCTSLSDLSPLEKLSGLQELHLTGCTSLSDLGPLEKLSGLQTLYLGKIKARFSKTISRLTSRGVEIS